MRLFEMFLTKPSHKKRESMSLLKRALKTTVLLVVAILIGWGVQQWIYQSTADAI